MISSDGEDFSSEASAPPSPRGWAALPCYQASIMTVCIFREGTGILTKVTSGRAELEEPAEDRLPLQKYGSTSNEEGWQSSIGNMSSTVPASDDRGEGLETSDRGSFGRSSLFRSYNSNKKLARSTPQPSPDMNLRYTHCLAVNV